MAFDRCCAESPIPAENATGLLQNAAMARPQYPQSQQVDRTLEIRPPSAVTMRTQSKLASTEVMLMQEILNSVLRQEAALREEHAQLRGVLQKQHEVISGKVDSMASQQVIPETLVPVQEAKLAAATKSTEFSLFLEGSQSPQPQAKQVPLESQMTISSFHPDDAVKLAKQMKIRQTQDAEEALRGQIKCDIETATGLTLRMRKIVLSHTFDIFMGIVILVNMFVTAVQLQWQGYGSAHRLGISADDKNWSKVEVAFDTLDVLFNLVYLIEFLMRLIAIRLAFCKSLFNLMDALIVLSTCSETFIIKPFAGDGSAVNLSALRIMRFFRIFRMGRVTHLLHTMENLREMRILIQTLMVSVRGLVWSVMLIGGIILAAAIVMAQLTQHCLFDQAITFERREWMYLAFGTTARATYTIFVCTFTTSWNLYAGPYIEEVGAGFAFFFIPFVVLVNFAVMRVVAALFLKQTMQCADSENNAEELLKLQEKEAIAAELEKIFEQADTSKNGAISRAEFIGMLANEEVVACLSRLDIEIDEAVALFGVLCADDGEADYEEFLNGALKVNSGAKTIDTLQILHQVLEMHKAIARLYLGQ